LAAILDEVGFAASWEVVSPRGFEAGARLIEAWRVAGAPLAAVGHGIEAAVPSPLFSVDRQTRLDRDRADLNVTVKDVPAVGAFGVRAAG
jgi:hypothetical protein